ncbi:hypothetical protein ACLOJK_015638 [Asimina triloba]
MSDPSHRSGREKAWATMRTASSGIDRESSFSCYSPHASSSSERFPISFPVLLLQPDSPPYTYSHQRDPGHHLFRPGIMHSKINSRDNICIPARLSLDSIPDRVLDARFPFHFISEADFRDQPFEDNRADRMTAKRELIRQESDEAVEDVEVTIMAKRGLGRTMEEADEEVSSL